MYTYVCMYACNNSFLNLQLLGLRKIPGRVLRMTNLKKLKLDFNRDIKLTHFNKVQYNLFFILTNFYICMFIFVVLPILHICMYGCIVMFLYVCMYYVCMHVCVMYDIYQFYYLKNILVDASISKCLFNNVCICFRMHVCMHVCMYWICEFISFHEILFLLCILERGTTGVGIAHIVFSQVL